jgi:hypothetical protein
MWVAIAADVATKVAGLLRLEISWTSCTGSALGLIQYHCFACCVPISHYSG